MPLNWRFHFDNTAREGKNVTVFCFLAYIVHNNAFLSAEATQFGVGHTHNKQDQRFGVASTGLARSAKLEDGSCRVCGRGVEMT